MNRDDDLDTRLKRVIAAADVVMVLSAVVMVLSVLAIINVVVRVAGRLIGVW